jgi:hypothetical protein
MGTYETNDGGVTPVQAGNAPFNGHAEGSGPIRLTPIRFGEFLCQRDLITEEQLLEALGDHWSNGGNIGSAVERQGFLRSDVIEREAAAYHSLDTVEI